MDPAVIIALANVTRQGLGILSGLNETGEVSDDELETVLAAGRRSDAAYDSYADRIFSDSRELTAAVDSLSTLLNENT